MKCIQLFFILYFFGVATSAVQHERSPRAYGKKSSGSYLSDLSAGRQVRGRTLMTLLFWGEGVKDFVTKGAKKLFCT